MALRCMQQSRIRKTHPPFVRLSPGTLLVLPALLVTTLLLTTCSYDQPVAPGVAVSGQVVAAARKTAVASVTVIPTSATILPNATVQLTATLKDARGNILTGRTVTWTSSNTGAATVSGSGLVTGVAVGSATISATSEGKSGTSAISVTNVPVATVTVSPASASVQVGATVQLTATPKDASGNPLTGRTVTWQSADITLATVDANGLVTGKAAGGPVTVTATAEGKSGTSAITVTTIPVSTVDVTPTSATILVNGTVQLTATPKDASGNPLTGRTVTWATSNAAVATVTASGLVDGVAAGSATITATSEGKTGQATITVTAATDVVLVGAGDIASCPSDIDNPNDGDDATAKLLDAIPGTVFTLGDNVYENGTAYEYTTCYSPSWGRHLTRTRPTAGNHEYNTTNATGYYGYFQAAAGDPAKGYYSYDLGAWHVIVLNNYVDMTAGSAQEQWLRADLAASAKQCTVAMWHEPLFSDGPHGGSLKSLPVWQALYGAGAEIILSGHDHNYERFAPQRADGTADAAFGIREFVVGTGGASHDGFGTLVPNSEAQIQGVYGVLKLTLQPGGYTWQFVPEAGKTATDQGSGSCHGGPLPVANPGGPYAADGAVLFNGSASFDPQGDTPLTYAWNFGDATTGSGATPTHTYASSGVFTVTLVVTDSKGNASAQATTTATIGNQPPAVNAGPDWVISTGGSVNLSATFTDTPTDTPWSYTITWGDGSVESNTTTASPITSSHVYATSGQYTLQVSVTDRRGATGTDNAIVNVSDPTAAQVLVGAGDIARCDRSDDEHTAALLDAIAGTVFTIGDNVLGTSSQVPDFTNCYAPTTTWGRFKARTRPAPGHMESWSPGSATYYAYWGAAAGESGKGYYSYDLGAWHIIVLNSGGDISYAAGSAQEQWLKADLAASTKQCTLAIWHHPRFSSTGTALSDAVKPFWDDLYAAGAELVLNAHYEVYERFAPQTPGGVLDTQRGMRQFTVGTGGIGTSAVTAVQPNSEVRNPVVYGVLKLTLSATGYTWQFIAVGGTFSDTGTGSCH